ncbi:MAG: succinate dehydrogenase cytochrome b subunit [Bdellovibrionales bacterium]|jgi:succinate dehydrogenase / fumarate reductase, cytochrome b subunit|nr:succinate dehydrogenase cytochrome b subunit [Bdellovibrionales bacterium]MBT3525157.1 succinate dehydrogenase cytochrome b subunit [Bdellovibrionales bacterium]MBT7669104.1 succinate dehydrogenase cytochrome b subunit [Bdellovibrionales bacterium]MBT7767526.1 succinate dehydrogenase cytochrome b subunit [Bdellovibrionales bacterium]
MSPTCCHSIFTSSVGRKYIMAITGLMLSGFLLVHLIGNYLLLIDPALFNAYAHKLTTNPLIYGAEAILILIFLTHISLAIKLTLENRQARPQKYYVRKLSGRGATWASSTMPYTGILILIFLVLHLIHFKYGALYYATYDGVEMRDLHRLVIEFFQLPLHVAIYVATMVLTGFHLSHGFWSAFQSLGFDHPNYFGLIKKISLLYAIVIAVGYSFIPVWVYLSPYIAGGTH